MNGLDTDIKKVRLFGLDFFALTIKEAVTEITKAATSHQKKVVITPNVDHIVTIKNDPKLFNIWLRSDFLFADGMPIVWLSRIARSGSLPERVTGADLMPLVCEAAAHAGLKIMIIGGGPGVAETAKINLEQRHPFINIVGTICPDHGFEKDPLKSSALIKAINDNEPHILFFCVGAPKSERWLFEHREKLRFGIALCVGAAVDFVAGNVKRAPRWVRATGLEWCWRLCQEPGRLWKRYLIKDLKFILYVFQEIFSTGKNFKTESIKG